jgi:hypothetical protein
VLSREGASQRRKGMSSKMTSSAAVEIRVVPKDPATTARLPGTAGRVELFAFLPPEPGGRSSARCSRWALRTAR